MAEPSVIKALRGFPLGNLCNAHPGVRALGPKIAPLYAGAKLCGPARTARINPGQNAAIHRAVHGASPGDVLVVEAGGDTGFGPFGDILAASCRQRGVIGLVIDGTVRDAPELCEMAFPVFCRGANPTATQKSDPGEIGIPVSCAGVPVRPGDIIVADDDGVVVVPIEIAEDVAKNAARVVEREKDILARIDAGETTKQIFGL